MQDKGYEKYNFGALAENIAVSGDIKQLRPPANFPMFVYYNNLEYIKDGISTCLQTILSCSDNENYDMLYFLSKFYKSIDIYLITKIPPQNILIKFTDTAKYIIEIITNIIDEYFTTKTAREAYMYIGTICPKLKDKIISYNPIKETVIDMQNFQQNNQNNYQNQNNSGNNNSSNSNVNINFNIPPQYFPNQQYTQQNSGFNPNAAPSQSATGQQQQSSSDSADGVSPY